MYAIVDIAGQQFKVQKDSKIFVHRLDGDEGAEVSFDKVLLIENDDNVMVGEPVLEGAIVHAKILSHVKGGKVLVFKKKRRKGFKKLRGHRQFFSQILIEDIISEGGVKRAAVTKTKVVAEKKQVVAAVKEPKPKEPKVVKKPAAKKEEVKKATAKKPKAAASETKKEKAPVKKTTAAKTSKESKPAAKGKAKAKGKSAKK
jgi:large subunit ribosomal protein L21